jgi:hypothetical protein
MSLRRRRKSQVPFSLFAFQDIITSVTGVMIMVTLLLAVELVNRVANSPAEQTIVQSENLRDSVEVMRVQVAEMENRLRSVGDVFDDLPAVDTATLRSHLQDLNQRTAEASQRVLVNRTSLKDRLAALKTLRQQEQEALQVEADQIQQMQREVKEMEQSMAVVDSSDRMLFRSGVKDKETWIVEITARKLRVAQIGVRRPPESFAELTGFERWLRTRDRDRDALYLIVKPPQASDQFEAARSAVLSQKFEVGYTLVGAHQRVLDEKVGAGDP